MKGIKRTLLSLAFTFSLIVSWAQGFEGTITITETHRSSKVTKKMHVKGDKVLLETFLPNDANKLKGAKIVDLATGKVTALLPARKLYFEVPSKNVDRPLNVEVKKTGKTKTILEQQCNQIVVVSEQRRAKVAFWVAKGNFTFYAPLMKVLNKNENISNFFAKLEDKESGAMPMLMVESRLDETEITRREVISIDETTISDDVFNVPDGYSLMER